MLFSTIIEKKFDAVLGRYDGEAAMRYYSVDDFPRLKCQAFDIEGDKTLLKGFFYYYDDLNPENLIVFDHGIGAGHLAYLGEIECLAQQGYTVYSYDHTGCVLTGGTGILGFAQGLHDLDCVLTALHQDKRFEQVPRKIIGHSWGGYACMNVAALHPEVTHVVSLAGFMSARTLIEQYIPKSFLKYSEEVMERERQHNAHYADMDARESLKKSQAKLLYLQSRDDVKVKFALGYEALSQALGDRADTEYLVLDHKNHDPQRTLDSAVETANMTSALSALKKKKALETPDQQQKFKDSYAWDVVYQQDADIWSKIFQFFEN